MKRLKRENSQEIGVKLGTRSLNIWIHEDDLPLSEGDVIRYSKVENGRCSYGTVEALPPETIHPLIGLYGTPEKGGSS